MTLLVPPLSKSDAHRALVLAEVRGVPFADVLGDDELPRDVQVLRAGLEALRAPTAAIDCHDGGAPFRFLLAQACVRPGRVVRFTGTPRLGERPHEPLLRSLENAIEDLQLQRGTPWPLEVRTPAQIIAAPFEVTGVESSQFASALLLAATVLAARGQPTRLQLTGPMTSEGYFALTRAWVERAGFHVAADGSVTDAHPAKSLAIPGDWSSLSYLLALAWRSGAQVDRVDFDAAHPDREFVTHLEHAGLTVSRTHPVTVTGVASRGFEVDARRAPDTVPTLAALSAVLPTPSVFTHCTILTHKESDRLAATVELLQAAGAHPRVEGDTLHVTPGPLRDFSYDARDDHRMAMSAAVLAYLGKVHCELTGRDAVGKSFPGFWREVAKVGVR